MTVFGRANYLGMQPAIHPMPIRTLRGTENEYWPKCGDALRLGNTVLGGISQHTVRRSLVCRCGATNMEQLPIQLFDNRLYRVNAGLQCFLYIPLQRRINRIRKLLISHCRMDMKQSLIAFLWSPYVIGQTIIFLPCDFYLLSFFLLLSFFSSPNLSGRRLDVCHTSTHGVALVRI